MEVWPAIDLRGGKCVRLAQGDYARETVFGDDPVAMARHWQGEGARFLHLVDLDGARDGSPANLPIVRQIVRNVPLTCELGGGIRSEEAIGELLETGLARLVIGTKALDDPEWFRAACRRFPGRLVLGIDAKDGFVATHGWLQTSEMTALALARSFAGEPLAAVIYTDIATDGMLCGPNLPAVVEMVRSMSLPIVASGGVANANHVADLAATGAAGCILGRSLYAGTLTLAEALAAAEGIPH